MKIETKRVLREFTENKELMSERKVVVKSAGHKGNGLFAKVDIKKGEKILKAKVEIISDKSWKLIKNTEAVRLYWLRWGDEHGIPTGPWEFEFKKPQDKEKWDEAGLLDDGKLMISGFLYINDIDDKTEANSEEWFDIDEKLVGMVATRDIKAGEEIIKEYNETMAGKWRKELKEGLNLPKKDISTPEKWFQSEILNKVNAKIVDQYPNHIFYNLGNDVVMEYYNAAGRQELKNGELYVSYPKIWSVFESRFGLEYGQIQSLIKGMVESDFKFEGLTPNITLLR